jgi:GDP-L-fucose synthase
MSLFAGRRVLVAGGTGLIGRPLVELLVGQGASVRVVSLDEPSQAHPETEFQRLDLASLDNCMKACEGMDYVFNLVGVKGSPAVAAAKPASFLVPMLLTNTGMMEAARRCGARRYLYTSSIGVYAQDEVLREDDVWKTSPSSNDRFAGWAKRIGELQAEAYRIEHGWDRASIVRPANVYGPFDDFDSDRAMVVPSLIRRAAAGEDPFRVWGDGSPVRDFIHAADVARGMLLVMEKGVREPVNLGSGKGVSIRELVDIVLSGLERRPKVVWDSSKPSGDPKRLMDVSRARALGFECEMSLEQGVRQTLQWYRENR